MKIANRNTGEVIELSPWKTRVRRMQRRVKAWADLVQYDHPNFRLVMITLTYREIEDWRPGQIREFMLTLRKNLAGRLLSYAWVAELQKRGAVHYHVLVLVKKGTLIPEPDKSGWWVHGLTRIETARSPFYVLKYTGKEYQKTGFFPKGLRMFAVWVSKELAGEYARWFFRISAVPSWLRTKLIELGAVGAKFTRYPGGGWEVLGKVYKSPWVFMGF